MRRTAQKLTFLSLFIILGGLLNFGQSVSPAWADEDEWTTSSLAGYRILAVTIDPTNSDNIYVGTDRGLLRSQNGGQSWRGFPELTGEVNSILVHAQNTAVLFITMNNQLVKSDNSGLSWSILGDGVLNGSFRVDAHPLRPDVIYVYTYSGLFRSPDGGVTWSGAGLPVTERVQAIAFDPSDANVMYVALINRQGLFRTDDGGQSWSLISGTSGGQGFDIYRMSIDSSGALFVQTRAGIYRTTDSGQSWQVNTMEEPVRSYRSRADDSGFTADGVQPNLLYHGWENSLLRSVDGGVTWEQFDNVLTGWPGKIMADPQQEGKLYAIANQQLYVSVNGGTTWQDFQRGASFQRIAAHPAESSVVFGLLRGRGNGPWRSQDRTQSWQSGNIGLEEVEVNIIAFDPTNANTVYAGTQAGLYRSVDGGSTWSVTGLPTNIQVLTIAIDPQTNTNLYVGGSTGLLRSTNNGESWTAASAVNRNVSSIAINPEAPQSIYAAANNQLYRSQDGGESWNIVSHPGQQIYSVALKPDAPNTIYTGARDGLFISRDGGVGWSKAPIQAISGSNSSPFLRIDPRRPEALYMGWGTELFISPDAGHNWFRLTQGAPGLTVNDLAVDVGEPLTLYATFRDGAGGVWQYTLTNLPEPPTPTPTLTPIPTTTPRATPTPPLSSTAEGIIATATALAMNRSDAESTAAAVFGLDQDEDVAGAGQTGTSVGGEETAAMAESTSVWSILGGVLLLAAIVGGGVFVWRFAQTTGYSEAPADMASCPSCGATILPGARFCAKCGHQIRRNNEAND